MLLLHDDDEAPARLGRTAVTAKCSCASSKSLACAMNETAIGWTDLSTRGDASAPLDPDAKHGGDELDREVWHEFPRMEASP